MDMKILSKDLQWMILSYSSYQYCLNKEHHYHHSRLHYVITTRNRLKDINQYVQTLHELRRSKQRTIQQLNNETRICEFKEINQQQLIINKITFTPYPYLNISIIISELMKHNDKIFIDYHTISKFVYTFYLIHTKNDHIRDLLNRIILSFKIRDHLKQYVLDLFY